MGLFDGRNRFYEKPQIQSIRQLTNEEIKQINRATITCPSVGWSIKFELYDGTICYLEIHESHLYNFTFNQEIDLHSCKLVVLSRNRGLRTQWIYKITFKESIEALGGYDQNFKAPIFYHLQRYWEENHPASKDNIILRRNLTVEELKLIQEIEIFPSRKGLSACLFLRDNKACTYPLSGVSIVDNQIDKHNIQIVKLINRSNEEITFFQDENPHFRNVIPSAYYQHPILGEPEDSNIFHNASKFYHNPYNIKPLELSDIKSVEQAIVVQSSYNKHLCEYTLECKMVNGGHCFLEISPESKVHLGQIVDLSKCEYRIYFIGDGCEVCLLYVTN